MIKLYTLTICYNEETEEIEFIEESVNNTTDNIVSIGDNILKEYFSDEEIAMISENDIGEA